MSLIMLDHKMADDFWICSSSENAEADISINKNVLVHYVKKNLKNNNT